MKTKQLFELDPERLATTDEHGQRVYLYPEDLKGFWLKRRHQVYWFLILLYLILPWLYFDGKPALMINIMKREFTFFGYTIHGVEPLLFFFLLGGWIFGIALITSLWGRVWCGWGCPQTVFIQSIFLKLERLVEGKARERRELDQAPISLKKVLKKTLKWSLFLIVSLHVAHTFIGYFVGPRELFIMTLHYPSENPGVFAGTMFLTILFLLDFGWFREQFCIIVCPYGRMQSVAMDEHSLVIAYDTKRGEPRRGSSSQGEGDCINCYNCVKVCPTGIDIRRGTQLECIACTRCIDACDDIMTKLKKPLGLIRYSSEAELQGNQRKKLPLRSIIYLCLFLAFGSLFFLFLNRSTNLQMFFLRDKVPFQVVDNGETVVNHFTLKLMHQGRDEFKLNFSIQGPGNEKLIKILTPIQPTVVKTAEKKIIIFFKFPKHLLQQGTRKVMVEAIDEKLQLVVASREVTLVGPVD